MTSDDDKNLTHGPGYVGHGLDRPMLRNHDSVHMPGHIVLPLPSLVMHPFPGSVHPSDNLEQQSVSDIVRKNVPLNTVNLHDSIDWEYEAYRKRFGGGRRVSVASIGGDHPKKAMFIAALPILPMQAAVVCMILNILAPGLGK